jgi:serine protease Do
MIRKELMLAGAAGAMAAVIAGAGAQLAIAAEQSHAVNAQPMAPQAGLAPASFADIIDRVAPAVVSIEVEQKGQVQRTGFDGQEGGDPFGDLRKMFPDAPGFPQAPQGREAPIHGAGSGFFVSADGFIVTNNHVVENATKITVHTKDDRALPAHVVGVDPATDLAVVKVDGQAFPFVNFEDRAKPRVGDWVIAVGNPYGLGGTATAGIVSALKRPNVSGSSYVDYMQIDAPINRGNSGGPTFDVYGRVVGVNSAIFSPSGGSVGIGFDIPADVADHVVKQLISSHQVVRGFIGATVQDVTPEIAESLGLKSKGALVGDVTPGGPSDRAGLKMGDVVQAIDGRPIDTAAALTREVAMVAPGQALHMQISRDGHAQTIDVISGVRPSEAQLASNTGPGPRPTPQAERGALGLSVAPNPGGGVRVQGVDPSSDAAQKGVRPGDVIEAIGGKRISSPQEAAQVVAQAKAQHRKDVLLLVARNGQHIYLPVEPTSDSNG